MTGVAGDESRTSGRWGCLLGAWLLNVASNSYLIVPASVLAPMMETFGTGPGLTVWVVSAAFAGWAVSNVAIGVVIDRTSDLTVATAATLLLVATAVWGWDAGRSGAFVSLVASRAVAGVAIGALWTTGANVVGRAFSDVRQGTALGIFTASAPVALALGQFLGPIVGTRWGWPSTLLGFGLAALAGFAVFLVGHHRTDFAPIQRSTPSLRDLVGVLREPPVAYGSALGLLAYSLFLFFNSWMPTYLAEEFTLPVAVGGLFVALFPAIGVVSRAGGGIVSDRLLGGRRRPLVRWSFLASTPLVVAIAATNRVALLVVLLVVAGFAIQLAIGILYSYVRESVDPARHGTALSVLVTAGMTGAFAAPAITGWLIEVTGSYRAAFGFAFGLGVFGILLAWRAPESGSASVSSG